MTNSRMRCGLIGAGAIAQTYVQAFAQSTAATVVGITDIRQEAAEALGDRLQCPVFTSYKSLVDELECEAVIICTPPVTHPEIACWMLDRGVHVLCEKPLAISPDQARRMLESADRSGSTLTMASKFRYAADVI